MNCLPSTAIRTLLVNESFRIAISQCLGLPVCAPHKCRCGAIVDRYGLHPLSCRFSAGRLPRHSALNDNIKRAMSSAGFNAVLEPVGLDRGDGKRPDGMTVFPFSRGKYIIWHCTCVETFSPSALAQAHELGLHCVMCELHFVIFTLCIFHKLIDILPTCHINKSITSHVNRDLVAVDLFQYLF